MMAQTNLAQLKRQHEGSGGPGAPCVCIAPWVFVFEQTVQALVVFAFQCPSLLSAIVQSTNLQSGCIDAGITRKPEKVSLECC